MTPTENLIQSAIRLDNDINGNPRYYFPKFVWPDMSDKTRYRVGLSKYRGKKYGAGYVMQSYNLPNDIDFALRGLMRVIQFGA